MSISQNTTDRVAIPKDLIEQSLKYAERIVQDYKKRYSDFPPFYPQRVAEDQYNIKVREKKLTRSGCTLTYGGEQFIVLNEGEPYYRKRFTCAHELAHILLRDLPIENRYIEPLCDIFAANLLMPAEAIEDFSQNIEENFTFEILEEMNKSFKVSLESLIFRIKVLKLIRNPNRFILILKEGVNRFTGYQKKLRVYTRVSPAESDFYIPENIGADTLGLSKVGELIKLGNLESKVVPNEHLIPWLKDPHTGKYKQEDMTCKAKYKCYGSSEYNYIVGLFDIIRS